MKNTKKTLILSIVMGLLTTSFLQAQERTYMGDMGEVLVTPVKRGISAFRWPGAVSLLNEEDIKTSGAVTVDQALSELLGISQTNITGSSGRGTVDSRGLGESAHLRTLVLVDGQRMNRTDMGGINWLEIPLSSVEKIEVIRGASAVIHGNNSAGGVINIITKKQKTGESPFNYEAFSGSYGLYGGRLAYNRNMENLAFEITGNYLKEDGYRKRSASESKGASLRLMSKSIPGFSQAALSLSYGDSFYEMPGSLSAEEVKEDRRQALYTDWSDYPNSVRRENKADEAGEKVFRCSTELDIPLSRLVTLLISGGYSDRMEEMDMASYPSFADRHLKRGNFSPTISIIPLGSSFLNELSLGGEVSMESLVADRFSSSQRDTPTGSLKIRMPVYGAYAYGEAGLTKNLLLTAGYRYESAEINIKQDSGAADGEKSHAGQAMSVGLVYLPVSGVRLYSSAATHYRYPASDEQASYQGFGDSFFANLNPEGGYSAEAGVNLALRNLALLDISLYRRLISDMVAWDDSLYKNVNMDNTLRDGIEGSLTLMPNEKITLRAGACLGKTVFDSGENKGNFVPLTAVNEYSASLNYALFNRLNLRLSGSYSGETYEGGDYANQKDKIPARTLVDAGLKADLSSCFKLSFGIRNVFDKKYSFISRGGYYPAPGRNWFLNLQGNF
ncbi:MAG: TonB-dependent receptor [Elusimicrobia bacterium]|nr:TonB-dependent receptor [Elusimicrobiota bacterium]